MTETPTEKTHLIKSNKFSFEDMDRPLMDQNGDQVQMVYMNPDNTKNKNMSSVVTLSLLVERIYNQPLLAPELEDEDIVHYMDSCVEFFEAKDKREDFYFSDYTKKEFFTRIMQDQLPVFVMRQFYKMIKQA